MIYKTWSVKKHNCISNIKQIVSYMLKKKKLAVRKKVSEPVVLRFLSSKL